jgi:preprotein translocase subunit SecG
VGGNRANGHPQFSDNIMGLFHFLLAVFAVVAASLVGVILMQRSEGGGLGMGGSPSGLMSARGAGDFLTRTTAILAALFIILAVALAFVSAQKGTPGTIDESLDRSAVTQPVDQQPAAQAPAEPAPAGAAPAEKAATTEVPLDK